MEMSRDIATQYCETALGSLQEHKFDKYVLGDTTLDMLPNNAEVQQKMRYLIEVYVDNFMALVILTTKKEVIHVGWAVMRGIHDVFPEDHDDLHDPISEKKLVQKEGCMSTQKTLLGFDFDGEDKTLWLEEGKRNQILTTLHGWLCTTATGQHGIPFKEFESVVAWLRHAFMALPAGLDLLSPCNAILRK